MVECPQELSVAWFVVGVILLCIIVFSFVPQVIAIWKAKSSRGLSLTSGLLQCLFGSFAVLHGLSHNYVQLFECCTEGFHNDWVQCAGVDIGFAQFAAIGATGHVFALMYFIYFKEDLDVRALTRKGTKMVIAFTLALEGVMATIFIVLKLEGSNNGLIYFGWLCLALALAVTAVIAVPQLLKTWRTKDVAIISTTLLAVQGPGFLLSAYFQSVQFDFETWIPLLLSGLCSTALLALVLFLLFFGEKLGTRSAHKEALLPHGSSLNCLFPQAVSPLASGRTVSRQSSFRGSLEEDEYLLVESGEMSDTTETGSVTNYMSTATSPTTTTAGPK